MRRSSSSLPLLLLLLAGCGGPPPSPAADSSATAEPVSAAAPVDIRGSTWILVSLRGVAVVPGARGAPTLQLGTAESQVVGFGGCNRLGGSYTLKGAALTFGPLLSTRMACPDVMATEAAFSQALAEVRGWRLRGAELELVAGDTVLATLRQP
jgi:heat shock protein HslJ